MKEIVTILGNCERLDVILQKRLKEFTGEISNSKIRRLIFCGAVKVSGKQMRHPAYMTKSGEKIDVFIEREKLFLEKTCDDAPFSLTEEKIVYEDGDILCVDKPARFPTEPTFQKSRENLLHCVVDFLFERQKILFPNAKNPPFATAVHRLDRDTSGLVLFAKNRAAAKMLHESFENRTVKKSYFALVENKKAVKDSFFVEFFMGRVSKKSESAKWGAVLEKDGGKFSRTEFFVLGERKIGKMRALLLECQPITGRTHQIRVHLSSLGLPIIGDERYGGAKFPRLLLHAHALSFLQPSSKEKVEIESKTPKEFL